MKNNPIPYFHLNKNWRKVSINENSESLISLKELNHPFIQVKPIYYQWNISNAMNDCFVRTSVAEKLIEACTSLPEGYSFIILDSWRPIEVQKSLFTDFREKLHGKYPNLSIEELNKITSKYVSLPSTDPINPSPHLTGGSIDITLAYYSKTLSMGTLFDDFSPKSSIHYYEEKLNSKNLSSQEIVYLKNRRFLYYLLSDVGFTNYPEEWWHFDYGNQFWGSLKSTDALYGPIIDVK